MRHDLLLVLIEVAICPRMLNLFITAGHFRRCIAWFASCDNCNNKLSWYWVDLAPAWDSSSCVLAIILYWDSTLTREIAICISSRAAASYLLLTSSRIQTFLADTVVFGGVDLANVHLLAPRPAHIVQVHQMPIRGSAEKMWATFPLADEDVGETIALELCRHSQYSWCAHSYAENYKNRWWCPVHDWKRTFLSDRKWFQKCSLALDWKRLDSAARTESVMRCTSAVFGVSVDRRVFLQCPVSWHPPDDWSWCCRDPITWHMENCPSHEFYDYIRGFFKLLPSVNREMSCQLIACTILDQLFRAVLKNSSALQALRIDAVRNKNRQAICAHTLEAYCQSLFTKTLGPSNLQRAIRLQDCLLEPHDDTENELHRVWPCGSSCSSMLIVSPFPSWTAGSSLN